MPEAKLLVIATLITERPLCAECLATKADVTTEQLSGYFERIARAVTVYDEIGCCRSCRRDTVVFSVRRS